MADGIMISAELRSAVSQVRERIAQIRSRRESVGEQNTKAALIDPILRALGWDTEDIDEVRREYKSRPQDGPVDYALLIRGTPRLFVEAKDISCQLNDRRWISQIVSYAAVAGVKWCVLTNGDEYRLYNTTVADDVERKLFRSVSVCDAGTEECTLQTLDLLSRQKLEADLIDEYWREYWVDQRVKTTLEGLLSNDDRSLIRLIKMRVSDLTPSEIRESLRRATIDITFPSVGTLPVSGSDTQAIAERLPEENGEEGEGDVSTVTVPHLIAAGLISPPLRLEKSYRGQTLTATILENGKIECDGRYYSSPSISASMARKSVIGAPPGRRYPNTNGWRFWRYRDPETGQLRELDTLRRQFAQRRSA